MTPEVLVHNDGRVAIQWRDAWHIARPGGVNDVSPVLVGTDTTNQLGPGWQRLVPAATQYALDDYSRDMLGRCRIARRQNGGRPRGTWSTGEQLAVALVLGDNETLDDLGYDRQSTARRVFAELTNRPVDMDVCVTAMRVELAGRGESV